MVSSTVLSYIVLALTLVSVISFASMYQQIRYFFIQRFNTLQARTEEVVSVSALISGETAVIDVRNTGGVGVMIDTLKAVVTYKVYEADPITNEVVTYTRSSTKTFRNIHLSPLERKLVMLSIEEELPQAALRGEISFLSVIVITDKNVFIYDPAPAANSVALKIYRSDIGKTFTITLPNGRIAYLTPYEYLVCSVGPAERTSVSLLEASNVYVAFSPDDRPASITYNYGYDPSTSTHPEVLFRVAKESLRVNNVGVINLTRCSITALRGYNLQGYYVSLTRGIILLGTQLSGYDVVSVSFASRQFPVFYPPSQIDGRESEKSVNYVKTNAFVLKLCIPSSDVDVLDFLGVQSTPYSLSSVQSGETVIDVGTCFSQAILVSQSVTGFVDSSTNEVSVYADFQDPYPLLVIISSS